MATIIEDDLKRYYIHVTTSKNGVAFAEKSVMEKESRNNFKFGTKWFKYSRDFSGDIEIGRAHV